MEKPFWRITLNLEAQKEACWHQPPKPFKILNGKTQNKQSHKPNMTKKKNRHWQFMPQAKKFLYKESYKHLWFFTLSDWERWQSFKRTCWWPGHQVHSHAVGGRAHCYDVHREEGFAVTLKFQIHNPFNQQFHFRNLHSDPYKY